MILIIQNKEVLIDDEDYAIISQYTWHIDSSNRVRGYIPKLKKKQRLHRLIKNVSDPNIIVDHINRNTLDNRKCNLRICNKKQNTQNKSSSKNATSKYLGVFWAKDRNKWDSNIKKKSLGYYLDEKDAALAYNIAAQKEYGEFAALNII